MNLRVVYPSQIPCLLVRLKSKKFFAGTRYRSRHGVFTYEAGRSTYFIRGRTVDILLDQEDSQSINDICQYLKICLWRHAARPGPIQSKLLPVIFFHSLHKNISSEGTPAVTKLKYNTSLSAVAAVLLILIDVRLVLPDEACFWVSFINYTGLVISAISLFWAMCGEYGRNKKFHGIAGAFIILFFVLLGIGVFIALNILVPNGRADDCIMLFTLFISLPAPLYVELMSHYLKR